MFGLLREPELHDCEVYCDVHGCVHDRRTDPYQYGYEATGSESECGPADWCKLWIEKGADDRKPKRNCITANDAP